MASIHFTAHLEVPAEVAWDFLDRYTRSEVHMFSACVAERQEGEYRVVTLADGTEVGERNVTVDPGRMRAVYTVPGLAGAEHHQAEMRVDVGDDGRATLVWTTDILPGDLAPQMADTYSVLFSEMLVAVNGHRLEAG